VCRLSTALGYGEKAPYADPREPGPEADLARLEKVGEGKGEFLMPATICGVGIVSVLGRLASCEAGTLLEKVSIVH